MSLGKHDDCVNLGLFLVCCEAMSLTIVGEAILRGFEPQAADMTRDGETTMS